jgi:hypothetical protein
MGVRTQIPGAQQLDLAHHGQHTPRTHLAVTGLMTAGTTHLALIRAGSIAPQQRAQRDRSGSMHGRPHSDLDGLQIESARLTPVLKRKAQERAYFPFGFLTDRFRRLSFRRRLKKRKVLSLPLSCRPSFQGRRFLR